jgi:transcriptional regulator with XRE-family HTH domain
LKNNDIVSKRIKKAMELRDYKQIDVVNRAKPLCKKYNSKFTRSDICLYLSGKAVPKQEKLYILSLVLDVNIAWLIGLDVPMEHNKNYSNQYLDVFDGLSKYNFMQVVKYARFLRDEQ